MLISRSSGPIRRFDYYDEDHFLIQHPFAYLGYEADVQQQQQQHSHFQARKGCCEIVIDPILLGSFLLLLGLGTAILNQAIMDSMGGMGMGGSGFRNKKQLLSDSGQPLRNL